MLAEVYRIGSDIGERISNVVIMGSGEPLDNYDEVVKFLRMITDEKGLHISARNITLSTCGLTEKIRALGGALFCERRYGRVFTFHNGADSYYSVRGWRGVLRV